MKTDADRRRGNLELSHISSPFYRLVHTSQRRTLDAAVAREVVKARGPFEMAFRKNISLTKERGGNLHTERLEGVRPFALWPLDCRQRNTHTKEVGHDRRGVSRVRWAES